MTEARGRSLVKGVAISLAAAAAHHVTLIFGVVLFAGPVLWVAYLDAHDERVSGSVAGVLSRAAVFAVAVGAGVGLVLLPYWLAIIQHPIHQIPIPHDSRANFLLNSTTAINYFVIPYGALILALPFILIRGAASSRLRPLLIGFWLTLDFRTRRHHALAEMAAGPCAFEILTFERFTFWATLLAMPIVGILAIELLDRFRSRAAVGLSLAAVSTVGAALWWLNANPYRPTGSMNVQPVIAFLNRDGHDAYRYVTLGFGSELSKVSTYTSADSVDGDYNSARLLPEMTHYGSAQLTNAKFYGSAGMASLRAMLEHANRYGLKYIFVHDSYYEPLLTFVGWRKIETFGTGEITAWSKEDVPPAHKIESDAVPAPWQGLLWGILPIGVSFLAIFLELLLPEQRRMPADRRNTGTRRASRTTFCGLRPPMKFILPIILVVATAALMVLGLFIGGQARSTVGIAAGSAVYTPESDTPEQALKNLLVDVQRRNWDRALAADLEEQRHRQAIFHSGMDGLERQPAILLGAGRL